MRSIRALGAAAFVAAFAFAVLIFVPHVSLSSTASLGSQLSGWLWSDTVGWVSLNCNDPGTCGTVQYAVSQDQNGNLSGWGWSDNAGWVDFNAGDLAGCPQTQAGNTGCAPKIDTGNLKGWARACAGTQNGDCTGASRTDGWDGWVSLTGTSPYAYGGTLDASGTMSGYAWGSDVVGWLLFQSSAPGACQDLTGSTYCVGNDVYQNDTYGNQCLVSACAYQCASGACIAPPQPTLLITATPSVVAQGKTVTIAWSASNVEDVKGTPACSVTSNANGDSWTSKADKNNNSSGSQTSSPIVQQTVYTLTCTGLDGSPRSASATINILPQFREL